MKASLFILFGAALVPFLSGCASQPVALPPMGPPPAGQSAHAASGYLQVFSDTETHYIGDGPPYYPHKGYNIHDESGKRVKYVPNHIGDMDETPTVVRIPEGHYTIRAESTHYGRVVIPVIIEAGRKTVLHLDGEWRPSNGNSNAIVRLPDGEAVGWNGSITKARE